MLSESLTVHNEQETRTDAITNNPPWHLPLHGSVDARGTPEPNYFGRQLHRQLKGLREKKNRLTQEEAGERVHIEFKKLSRIERRQLPTYHELVMLLDIYGILSCDYGPYLDLLSKARRKPWWRGCDIDDTRYIRMEDEADTKIEFQLGHIPTLLQTEQYARHTSLTTARRWPRSRWKCGCASRNASRLNHC